MEKPEKLQLKTEDLTNENIKKLSELFPEILTEIEKDGKTIKTINVEKLKELVGDIAEKDSEIYELTWAGKQKARRIATQPTTKTLRPVIEDSVNFENTENLYIEGDNLEVLKILRKSYSNSIKMIYIDPPYNTGKDFIYKDNFSMSKEDYEKEAGAVDEEGNRLIKNTGADGRYHSNWLNMMYPRLQLAYKLLKKDGVIFISIDDNEVDNLRKICDEIFGENNFVANFIVTSAPAGTQSSTDVAQQHSYCLMYKKSSDFISYKINLSEDDLSKKYNESDENGRYYVERLWKRGIGGKKEDVPSLHFPVYYDEKNNLIFIDDEKGNSENLIKIIPYQTAGVLGRWTWSKQKMKNEKEKLIVKKVAGEYKLHKKKYESEELGKLPYSIITANIARTELGSIELKKILDGKYFDYPKYSEFVKYFLKFSSNKNDIILDFFSGSATTAHAVMQLNAEDGGTRKFIMVQLPEPTDPKSEAHKAGYKNICEIGKERIRRAGNKIKEENKDKDLSNVDFGFRVFKLDSSNMKDTYYNPNAIDQKTLINFKESIKEDRTEEDLLYQVLLDMGIPISAKVEIKTIQNKKVFIVNDGWLIACFDENIDLELIKELAEIKPEIDGLNPKFVFRESSFKDDSAIINTMEYLKTKLFKTDAELKSNVKVV